MPTLSLCLSDFGGIYSGGQTHTDTRIIFIFAYVAFLGVSYPSLAGLGQLAQHFFKAKILQMLLTVQN